MRTLYIGNEAWYLDTEAEGELDGWGRGYTGTMMAFIDDLMTYTRNFMYACPYVDGAIPSTQPSPAPTNVN